MDSGSYLFVQAGYNDDCTPQLVLYREKGDSFEYVYPRGQGFTMHFDTSQRFCTGWHDLATSNSFPCPDSANANPQYSQCPRCKRKTGFNPAFYHATTISPQQQARNLLPHSLYLAHFAPGVIKVGITWAGRGIHRLLDQGARSALIVKTFPSAGVARRYEASAAKLKGIFETIQTKAKLKMLAQNYDPKKAKSELRATLQRLEQEIGITSESHAPLHLDDYYLQKPLDVSFSDLGPQKSISGLCIGMIGSNIITEQNNEHFLLPLSKLTGYTITLSNKITENSVGPKQTTLF